MNCNYKPDPKKQARCGDETVDGAKMCPTHQKKHREYMRAYRARKRTQDQKQVRTTTLKAIGKLVDELVESEANEKYRTVIRKYEMPEVPTTEVSGEEMIKLEGWMRQAAERYNAMQAYLTEHGYDLN
jgi:hypothetical protein